LTLSCACFLFDPAYSSSSKSAKQSAKKMPTSNKLPPPVAGIPAQECGGKTTEEMNHPENAPAEEPADNG
jgi:hypothetical protein